MAKMKRQDPAAGGHVIERWALEELKPYDRNPRKHSAEQVSQLVDSMRQWGWTIPILATEDGRVIAGHGRLAAALRLGLKDAPVIVARGWSEAQIRAYVIADNQLALKASWDQELLGSELQDLVSDFDLGIVGFSDEELAVLLQPGLPDGAKDPDEIPELEVQPVSRTGDLWQLGDHRITCGDSCDRSVLRRVLGDDFADCVWTDPPYNVGYVGKGGQGTIQNDQMAHPKFSAFMHESMLALSAVLKPGGSIYVAHADTNGILFRRAFIAAGFKLSGCLVWVKNTMILGRSDYQWQHEPVLYGWRPGGRHRWYGGRRETTLRELDGDPIAFNPDGSLSVRIGADAYVVRGKDLDFEAVQPTVLRFKKPARALGHPTMKPVELISRMVVNSTKNGDLVLDAFGGSGSTLIACEQLGRHARLVELEPRFVDLTIRRWQNFSGKDARLLAGKNPTFAEVTVGGRS